jgi:NADH dehydrogenase
MTDHTETKVVVIGGGYSGTIAANHLRMRDDVEITLVNPRPTFVERIRLHQHAAGTYHATVDYGSLLGDGVRLVVDNATRIDTETRTVQLASRRVLDYDYLVYAVGSTGVTPDSVPGAAEFAYPVAELEHSQRLRAAIDELPPHAWITVVGAGLTGTETAAELAEQGRKVTLVCGGRLTPAYREPARLSVAKWLAKHHVTVLETEVVVEVRPDAVVFADGAVRPSALTVWTGGFGVPELAAASGLHTDALGRLLTDETLTSVDDDRIVAAGDAAAPSGRPLRMCCAAAQPLGAQAADTVLSRIAGAPPAVLAVPFAGSSLSLGRRAAVGQVTRVDDTPVNFHIAGRLAASVKEAGARATLWMIRREARKPGSFPSFKRLGTRPEHPVFEVITQS